MAISSPSPVSSPVYSSPVYSPCASPSSSLPSSLFSSLTSIRESMIPLAAFAKDPPLSRFEAEENMEKNGKKAILEHQREAPDEPWISMEEVAKTASREPPEAELHFCLRAAEARGCRDSMEDRYCHSSTEEGSLVALFDGHCGSEVAQYCKERVPSLFFECLKEFQASPHAAFKHMFDRLEREIYYRRFSSGSTAVVSFIDHKLWKIFTATIGDSEATLYRKCGEARKVLPLSCLRNWGSPKDFARWQAVDKHVEKLEDPKRMYYPGDQSGGVNVSRALGDFCCKTPCHETSPLNHKCKITVQNLLLGDLIILGCDGLKDYVREKEVVDILNSREFDEIPQQLVNYAIRQKESHDNVTVIALRILDKPLEKLLENPRSESV